MLTSPRPRHWLIAFRPLFHGKSMEIPPFREAVARICSQDKRYLPEAYLFLHDGLMLTLQKVQEAEKKPRQISGAELSDGLRLTALDQFGPMSKTVLNRWGIHTTRDFGELVFSMLNAGLLGKTDEDRIEDFDDLYTFDDVFRLPFQPATKPPRNAAKPSAAAPRKK